MDMKPVIPFEPIASEHIPEGDQWVAQVKWDGVRMLTYHHENETRLFNRRLNERTYHYPEITAISSYCSARSVILDGEVVALREGKPSFQQVMKRDGIRNLGNVASAKDRVPITYMIFDLLFVDGEWVVDRSLAQRQELLASIIRPNDHVQLVENFFDKINLYQVVTGNGLEGVVYKDVTSAYLINGKDQRWRKKKKQKDVIAVIGGVTYRDSVVNSLLLGLYDQNGQLWYIGNAGTGKLARNDWRDLTEGIKPIIQESMPFVNKPPDVKGVSWLQPLLTVKINFLEWTEGLTLRQPSIQAFVDVSPTECIFGR